MDGNYFEHIAQEIFKQKRLMEQLEAENRELRQRLAELRAGRGIFVDIAGSRFALRDSPSPHDYLARTR
jgi:cell division protein FtsB